MSIEIGTCNTCLKYGRLWKTVDTDDGVVTLCKKCNMDLLNIWNR
jgi:hypothetical protein